MEPHFEFILEARRKRHTWRAIAQQLLAQGIVTTPQGVHVFVKRRLKRRYALGMAPQPSPITTGNLPKVEKALSETPELTEPPVPASEFVSDPLTKPLNAKKRSPWTVLKPQP